MQAYIVTNKTMEITRINPKVTLQFIFTLFLFAFITLQIFTKNYSFCTKPPSITQIQPVDDQHDEIILLSTPPQQKKTEKCDLFTGEWVSNPDGPYYTNDTCGVIQNHQDCLKHGRSDTGFMKMKWKPDGCDLPIFDPARFLNIVRDKSLAFVGDSVARNQIQSLICLLYRVEQPQDVSDSPDDVNTKRYYYQEYNFTLAIYWSPFLVKTQQNDPDGRPGHIFTGLYLDEPDLSWTSHISQFNYVIISAGHWFARPLIYREKAQFIGCRYCEMDGLREYSLSYAYKNAFKTALRAILENKDFKGNVYLRTFAPSHFEGGEWNHGGDCVRKTPYKRGEIDLEGDNLSMYLDQVDVFNEAQMLAQKRGLKMELMDVTRIMLLRADGHPSRVGIPANSTWASDCVHWCLPGPVDSWNDFLLEMLRVDK